MTTAQFAWLEQLLKETKPGWRLASGTLSDEPAKGVQPIVCMVREAPPSEGGYFNKTILVDFDKKQILAEEG